MKFLSEKIRCTATTFLYTADSSLKVKLKNSSTLIMKPTGKQISLKKAKNQCKVSELDQRGDNEIILRPPNTDNKGKLFVMLFADIEPFTRISA